MEVIYNIPPDPSNVRQAFGNAGANEKAKTNMRSKRYFLVGADPWKLSQNGFFVILNEVKDLELLDTWPRYARF
jgi:hypothetical protein